MSLVTRVYLLVVLAVVPAFALHAYKNVEQRRIGEAQVHDEARRLVQFAAGEFRNVIVGARAYLLALASHPSIRAVDAANCGPYLKAMNVPSPFRGAFLVDAAGTVVCSSVPVSTVTSVADRSYFQMARDRREFIIGDAVVSRIDGVLSLPVALPILDDGGTIRGVLSMGLDAPQLEEAFRQKAWPEGGSISIIDRTGTIVVRWPNPELVGGKLSEGFRWMLEAQAEGTATGVGPDGVERIGAFLPPAVNQGMLVSVALSRAAALTGLDHALRRDLLWLGAITVLTLLAATLGGWYFIRRPVDQLRQAVSRLSAGDLTARADLPDQHSELGQLGAAFDGMAASVASRERDLRRSEELFRQFAENLPEVVWVEDAASGRTEYVGPAFERIWGRSAEGVRSGQDSWIDAVEPDDRPIIGAALAQARSGKAASAEYRIRRPDGSLRWLHSTAFPIRDLDGSLVRVGRVTRDVSERRALEEERLQALRQRDLLFGELNHRIKNNLQLVSAFLVLQSGRLEEPAAREALTAASQRIAAVGELHALLYRNGEIGRLDLGTYLRAICASLTDALIGQDRQIRIDLQVTPVRIDMDRAVLVGVIASELITNSLKYAYPEGTDGRVLVKLAMSGPRQARLRIADNGRGLAAGMIEGFGFRIIRMLARQLEARFEVAGGNGVRVDLEFDLPGSDEREAA